MPAGRRGSGRVMTSFSTGRISVRMGRSKNARRSRCCTMEFWRRIILNSRAERFTRPSRNTARIPTRRRFRCRSMGIRCGIGISGFGRWRSRPGRVGFAPRRRREVVSLLGEDGRIMALRMREIDQAEFAKRLASLLSERRFLARGLLRGMLALRFQPETPLIWGGVRLRYPVWCLGALFASIALNALAAAWFNSHGRPLPGAALLIPVAAILGYPAITFLARANGIKRKTPMPPDAFGR